MKKGWRIIGIVVLIAALLGAVSVGVGMLTGAGLDRIFSVLDEQYHIEIYYDYIVSAVRAVLSSVL